MPHRRPDQQATGRARRRPRGRGTSDYNAPLTNEARALIWTLAEEGHSQRATAERLNIAPGTVGRELISDPIRLEALRARQREARSTKWRALESTGLDEALAWLKELSAMRPRFAGTGRRQLSTRALDRLAVLPRIVASLQRAAAEGSKQVQLLTGGLTERIGGEQADLTAEQIVEMAAQAGLLEMLPPRLRAYAKERKL